MKLKGISVFEQHIEKMFAAIIFIALLAILAMQFLAGPAAIKVGNTEVPLGEAWGAVAENARRVKAKLDSTAVPEGNSGIATGRIVEFNDTYRGPVSPSSTLAAAIGESANIGDVGEGTARAIAPLAELVFPGPLMPIAGAHLTLVAPFEAQIPEVAAVLPPAMPFDKAGVTVEATFDGTALIAALADDPDGADGPIRAMPRHWWDGSIQILDVLMEREELTPTGEWASLTTIVPLPGRFTLREDLKQSFDGAAQLKERARLATEQAEFIRRPHYYASAIGEKWMTPTDRREMDEKLAAQAGTADEATRVRRQIADLQSRAARVEQDLADLGGGGRRPPPPSPPPGGGGGGSGGKGPGGGGGGGGGDRNPPREDRDNSDARRTQMESRLTQFRREIARLVERLRGMGEDVSMYGAQDQDAGAPMDPNAPATLEAPLLENASIRLWTHDVSVQRGKTYRYRLSVVLNNPMFGQGNVMVPEQQAWAERPVVYSEPSEWSDPVRVDDESYFFITSASPVTPLNRTAGARAEMYIFKWGRWRKGETQLEPGDRLRAEVKYPDISALIAAMPMDPAMQPDMPALQPARDDRQAPSGRAPGQPPAPSPPPNPSRDDRRDPGGRLPAPGGRPVPPQPDGQNQPRPDQLPILTEPVAVDAIFLSVAAAQAIEAEGRTRSGMVAYLRDKMGEVVPRYPDLEKASLLLARLANSAKEGATDFQPNQADPGRPPRPLPGRNDPPPPPGGGGGGGGA